MAALERLLAWPEISRSPQLVRFLGYIVQRTLDGDEAAIKAYSIAVDVFGRSPEFDPQADPIVRVQARRLRSLLDDYYRGPGAAEVMQIRLPVGRYVPEFVAAPEPGQTLPEAAEEPEPAKQFDGGTRFSISWFALAAIGLGLAMAAYALSAWRPEIREPFAIGAVQLPTITIMEFQNLTPADALAPQVAGLAIELVTDLAQFGDVQARYGGGGEANSPMGNLPASDFMLTGIVRPDAGLVQYSAILTDSRTGSVVWNQTLAVPAAEAISPDVLDRVSRSLSLVLGSTRGPLHVAARQFLASASALDGQTNPYLCRVLFDVYREMGGDAEAQRAANCFQSLPEAEQGTAEALAAMASLVVERGVPVPGVGSDQFDRLRLATENLERAILLAPINGFVWEQQARLHEGRGALALARSDFGSSVQLNPASPDALAAYARLLALSGSMVEAEPMALQALQGPPNPPAWYFGVPALLALRDGDLAGATANAERYAESDHELGPIIAIVAALRSGDSAVVNRYLPELLDLSTFRAQGVLPRLRLRITDAALLDMIRSALVQAGVPPMALIRQF